VSPRIALGFRHLADQVLRVADGAHAAAATAPGGLEHDGIADLGGEAMDFRLVVRQGIGGGHHRHADGDRKIARGDIVAELAHRIGPRADEGDAGGIAGIDEFRAFRQEAVAGMDRISAGKLCDADHFIDGEIALDRPEIAREMRATANLVAFVRLEPVQRQFVLFRPYRNRFEPQFIGRAEHADGNFGPVGDKDLGNGQVELLNDLEAGNAAPAKRIISG
jgi:hypothetical protein